MHGFMTNNEVEKKENSVLKFPEFKGQGQNKQKVEGWTAVNGMDYSKFEQEGDMLVRDIIRTI